MGLIYNPTESGELVTNFNANITACEQVISDLKTGNSHLVFALNSKLLSGAAFNAGLSMFSQLVNPTVDKVDTSIQELKTKLQQYTQYTDAAGSEILDEDKLNEQLDELRRQQALMTSQIQVYQNQARFSDEPDMTAMCYTYVHTLSNFLGTVQEDIRKVEEKLKKLQELDMKIASLFSDAQNEIQNLSTGILAINSVSIDSSGNFSMKCNDKDLARINKFLSDKGSKSKGKTKISKNGLDTTQKIMTATGYGATGNVAIKESSASLKKVKGGTWHNSSVNSTKSGLKTWKQVNGDVSRFKSVKGAKNLDEIVNGSGKIVKGSGIKGAAKSVGTIGGAGAVLDGGLTYLDRRDKYGETSAAIDGIAHTGTAVGSIYAGSAIGSLIPVPVVGTVAGAVGGYLVGGIANTLWDGFAHGTWNLDNFKLW